VGDAGQPVRKVVRQGGVRPVRQGDVRHPPRRIVAVGRGARRPVGDGGKRVAQVMQESNPRRIRLQLHDPITEWSPGLLRAGF